ncbi:hypothetical protein APW96_09510 [Staphylococcus aureus]|nr:hypothetical protein APW96_09510 [Staphylococcus aureus]
MNRQSTKKALLIPFVIMIITAIVLMGVWFIFNSLIALIASIVLVVMIMMTNGISKAFLVDCRFIIPPLFTF